MKKIVSIHNKTKVLNDDEMPYNSNNILFNDTDLENILKDHNIEFKPNNINVYRNAFVHKSYCTMKNSDFIEGNIKCPKDCLPLQELSYERLEFLGDAILGMVVANYMYQRYPEQNEGFLSKMRTKIVNGKMLGVLSNKIGLNKYAIMSKQVENANGRNNNSIMEDIFEAFIGAILIDYKDIENDTKSISGKGYYIAEKWIIAVMEKHIDFSELICTSTNFKDKLIQYMANHFQDSPKFFEMNFHINKANIKTFTYIVKDKNDGIIGQANGNNKKDAENNCSKNALLYYGILL
jgi:ribonuclease-3